MRTRDIIRRAGQNLRQAKARTILTSLAIGVGAFTIALAMAAGNGGRAYLDDFASGAGDMRAIQVSAKQEMEDDKPQKVDATDTTSQSGYRALRAADRDVIAGLDGVEKVSPIFDMNVHSVEANGSDPYSGAVDAQFDGRPIELSAGQLGKSSEIAPGDIVLPYKYVESFGFGTAERALGQKVTVTFVAANQSHFTREFTIAAVDKKPSSALAFYYDQFRISSKDGEEIAEAQRSAGEAVSYYALMAIARPGADVSEVKRAVEGAGQYRGMTFAEMHASAMDMMNVAQYGLMGFGALAILASIFGIINTQYISVLERTQQIGLMKALGARRRDIGKLFRYEAAWIGFLGGAIGVVLAYLVTLCNPLIADVLDLEEGTALLQMDWLMSGVLIVGLMAVAIGSGWFPSRKAAKLDPIEALRTE